METHTPQPLSEVAAGPLEVEHKTCAACGESKPFVPGTWYSDSRSGTKKAYGPRCLKCYRAGQKINEKAKRAGERARADAVARAKGYADKTGGGPAQGMPVDPGKLREAMGQGVGAVNEYAADLLALVMSYALDKSSTEHTWALKLMTERVLPAKMFAELGLNAAGLLKGGKAQTRQVTINIRPVGASDERSAGPDDGAGPGAEAPGAGADGEGHGQVGGGAAPVGEPVGVLAQGAGGGGRAAGAADPGEPAGGADREAGDGGGVAGRAGERAGGRLDDLL